MNFETIPQQVEAHQMPVDCKVERPSCYVRDGNDPMSGYWHVNKGNWFIIVNGECVNVLTDEVFRSRYRQVIPQIDRNQIERIFKDHKFESCPQTPNITFRPAIEYPKPFPPGTPLC